MDINLQKALDSLNRGGIVIFPTDTAFGIGCRIDKEESVKTLFKVRKRPETQATPVLVSSIEMAKRYLNPLPEKVVKLMELYWPGALTIVYNSKNDLVPELVRGGGRTLGVRMPNHLAVLELIKELGVPLLGPSANFHGEKPPFVFNDLDPELVKMVDYVINGECVVKQASTVVDCTVEPFTVIRQGAVII